MRPRYESSADLENERRFTDRMAASGWRFTKIPTRYYVDFYVQYKGLFVGWAEYKRRRNPSTQYPTLTISVEKIMRGNELAQRTGTYFWLFVEWSDGLYQLRLKSGHQYPVIMQGRTRGDPDDYEPQFAIPTNHFTLVP